MCTILQLKFVNICMWIISFFGILCKKIEPDRVSHACTPGRRFFWVRELSKCVNPQEIPFAHLWNFSTDKLSRAEMINIWFFFFIKWGEEFNCIKNFRNGKQHGRSCREISENISDGNNLYFSSSDERRRPYFHFTNYHYCHNSSQVIRRWCSRSLCSLPIKINDLRLPLY